MGAVYLAVQEVLQRRVALKLLRRELLAEPKVMRRFEREARAASRIDHPHITAVFDFGYSEEGVPYLVMEYVKGPTLSEVIAQQGPFAPERALHVLAQIASAVHAAHSSAASPYRASGDLARQRSTSRSSSGGISSRSAASDGAGGD